MDHFIAHWGYGALFAVTFLSSLGIPVGSEAATGYAGALASGALAATGHLNLVLVIAIAVAGEVAGSTAGYLVGRLGGRPLVDKVGRYVLLTHHDLDRAEAWFDRRGEPFVFFGRLVPLMRSFVSVAAGLGEMGFARFLVYTVAGSAIFTGLLAGIGYALGPTWHHAIKDFSYAGYVVAALIVAALAAVIWHRLVVVRAERGRHVAGRRTPASARPLEGARLLSTSGPRSGTGPRVSEAGRPVPARSPGPSSEALWQRLVPAPLAAKVPEVIAVFWVVKILTTAGGEATSDYLKQWGNIKGGAAEVLVFAVGLVLQFGTRRYRAFAYWFLAFAIAIFGTGVSDFLHLDMHIPYAGTSLLWAAILGGVFALWYRTEGTLSIHSITSRRREAFYWATVFATFALGTALGDFTAMSLHLGYLASVALFGVVFVLPALAWRLGLNGVAAFWAAYVVTRPLGASIADYISKGRTLSGIGFGDGSTAVVFALAVAVMVLYLAAARPDIQPRSDPETAVSRRAGPVRVRAAGPELALDVSRRPSVTPPGAAGKPSPRRSVTGQNN